MAKFKSISNFSGQAKSTVLRPAGPEDRPFVLSAARAFERFGPYEEVLARWFEDHLIETWLLEVEGKGAGFFMLGPLFPPYFRSAVDVMAIYVGPCFRRQGLGTKMLALAAQRAREAGYLFLRAHVGVDNRAALALFKKASFEIIKRCKRYYPAGLAAYELRRKISKR